MATAMDHSERLKCPICFEYWKEPKLMPVCQHVFCKTCLVKYASTLNGENGLDDGIRCPLCRRLNPRLHDPNTGITDWINSLEMVENVSTKTEQTAKHRNEIVCDSCAVFGNKSPASKFCVDCAEALCAPCSVGRHSHQLFKTHNITDIEPEMDSSTNESFLEEFRLLKDYYTCPEHPHKPVEWYCKEDERICCATCTIKQHRDCSNMLELQDTKLGSSVKDEMKSLMESIGTLSMFAESLIETRKRSTEANKKQASSIPQTLYDIRTKMNKIFDMLEESSNAQARAVTKKMSLTEERELEILNKVIKRLSVCLSLLKKTMESSSAGYHFAVLQQLKRNVMKSKAAILDLCNNFASTWPEIKKGSLLQRFLDIGPNDTNKLVTVIEAHEEVQLPHYEERDLLRNYTVTKTYQVSMKENYSSSGIPTFANLIFLPNDCAVVVDRSNGYIVLADKKYEVISSFNIMAMETTGINYANVPYSCSNTKDGSVAVGVPGQNAIYIVSANGELEVVRKLSTKHKPRAIYGLETGDLAVAWEDPVAFGIISGAETPTEKVYYCKDKDGRKLNSFHYITVDEARKHVIQPCHKENAVFCFNFRGYSKFKYGNDSLECPKGVALDRDGNIYICSFESSSLHIVSPAGLGIRIIRDECPAHPLAIAFKKNGEECAVTHAYSDVRVVSFFRIHKQ